MKLNVKNDEVVFGTNILKVRVPKALRNKFKSGLDFVDCALGGEGFTPSQVLLFTGTPGAGKTTMMLTLADQITKSGGLVVFNTAEESLFQVKLIAERLGLKSGFAVGQETHVPTLLEACDNFAQKVSNMGGGTIDCNQKTFTSAEVGTSFSEGDLMQIKVNKTSGDERDISVTVVFT